MLTSKERVGPYEIVAPIGAGGMGEVYRARDTRLGRDVAIKVLPKDVAANSDRLSRFEQESRSASALNHPSIVTIYDIGSFDSTSYIAMEYVEGKTLRETLGSGPILLRRGIHIAAQVADGLAKAHAAGIVHRDLKPENIMITKDGFAKILDFGLAKLTATTDGQLSSIQTQTGAGMIVGTAGYMSPEQASGKPVDFHSDQFSFGLILYEIITGKRAFQRSTVVETLSAIIKEEPESIAQLKPQTPGPIRWIVERCLAKDPHERYVSTADLSRDLQNIRDHFSEVASSSETVAVVATQRFRLSRLLLGLAMIALGLVGGYLFSQWKKSSASSELPKLNYLTYSGYDSAPAASPDGRFIAFQSGRDGKDRIWLKDLNSGNEVALTSGATPLGDDIPRFSADGSSILFTRRSETGNSLYRVSILGGEARKLIDTADEGDWSADGKKIVFSRHLETAGEYTSKLCLATADGGNVQVIAKAQRAIFFNPRWSPDGKKIAVVERQAGGNAADKITVRALDGKVISEISAAKRGKVSSVAWLASGKEIVYMFTGSITAILNPSGPLVRQNISSGRTEQLLWFVNMGRYLDVVGKGKIVLDSYSASSNLREIAIGPNSGSFSERWLTRGNSIDRQPAYSPDGHWIIFSSSRGGNLDVWKLSLENASLVRLTDDTGEDFDPAFTPDGNSITWSSTRSGHYEIWMADSDGSGARQITKDGLDAENGILTPDGKWLIYNSFNPSRRGIWKIHPDGTQDTQLAPGETSLPEVSPDGQYALYRIAERIKVLIRVVQIADGKPVPFEIQLRQPERLFATFLEGRARWMPDGKAIAFIGRNEKGLTGVYAQDFVPGKDTTQTKHPIGGFSSDRWTESLGISPDGTRLTIGELQNFATLMMAENVPDIEPPKR